MDGNHRWAKGKFLPGAAGHREGAKRLRPIVESCAKKQVKNLTVFAFSTENWGRPPAEIGLLMDLMRSVMEDEIADLHEQNVCLRVIGDRTLLAADIQAMMTDCEVLTQHNSGLNLNVAVNFGGRWDILQSVKALAKQVAQGDLLVDAIDESLFQSNLSLGQLAEPDLLIRTGGEYRVSNFLLWDLAYTELYFTPTLWPDFDDDEFAKALDFYASRARRFGRRP